MVAISKGKSISSQTFSHGIFPHKSITNFLPMMQLPNTPTAQFSGSFPGSARVDFTFSCRCSVSPDIASESSAARGCCGKSLCWRTAVPHRAGDLGHAAPSDLEHVGNLLWGSHCFTATFQLQALSPAVSRVLLFFSLLGSELNFCLLFSPKLGNAKWL